MALWPLRNEAALAAAGCSPVCGEMQSPHLTPCRDPGRWDGHSRQQDRAGIEIGGAQGSTMFCIYVVSETLVKGCRCEDACGLQRVGGDTLAALGG